MCKLQWPEGKIQLYYGDMDSLLLKVKTENLLCDLGNGKHISSQIDFTSWDVSICLVLVKL